LALSYTCVNVVDSTMSPAAAAWAPWARCSTLPTQQVLCQLLCQHPPPHLTLSTTELPPSFSQLAEYTTQSFPLPICLKLAKSFMDSKSCIPCPDASGSSAPGVPPMVNKNYCRKLTGLSALQETACPSNCATGRCEQEGV
jgi:hypothetical protein